MNLAIDDGSLLTGLQETSTDLATLLEGATATGDFSEVVVPILALLSSWYPDWNGQSETCRNDNNAPLYMKISRGYYESSLDACCQRWYNWNLYACNGDTGTFPSGFYPNWGGSKTKCFNSTSNADTLPDYMRKNPEQWLNDEMESCCEQHYKWAYSDCIGLSGGNTSLPATNKWYVNHQDEMCQQDCLEQDSGPCGGLAESWDSLYETAAICCEEKLSWVALASCEAQSTLTALVGTSQWYVNWTLEKCVKDCDISSDDNCGGLAMSWDPLYSSSGECCNRIWYIERDECTVE